MLTEEWSLNAAFERLMNTNTILYFQASLSLCLLKQCKIIFCSMLTEEWSLTEALAKCQPSPLQMPQWLINQCFLSLSCLLNYEFKYFQVFSPCMYFAEKPALTFLPAWKTDVTPGWQAFDKLDLFRHQVVNISKAFYELPCLLRVSFNGLRGTQLVESESRNSDEDHIWTRIGRKWKWEFGFGN